MFVYNIAAECDLCKIREQYKEEQFSVGAPLRLQVPKGWRMIGIDSEGKHANVLACEAHDQIDVAAELAKIPAPPKGAPETVINPKR